MSDKLECGDEKGIEVSKHQGRLELTWIDKDKTLLSAGDGQYHHRFVAPSDHRVSEVRLLHMVDRVEAPSLEGRPADLPQSTDDNLLADADTSVRKLVARR